MAVGLPLTEKVGNCHDDGATHHDNDDEHFNPTVTEKLPMSHVGKIMHRRVVNSKQNVSAGRLSDNCPAVGFRGLPRQPAPIDLLQNLLRPSNCIRNCADPARSRRFTSHLRTLTYWQT
jgi:hypothetical protein